MKAIPSKTHLFLVAISITLIQSSLAFAQQRFIGVSNVNCGSAWNPCISVEDKVKAMTTYLVDHADAIQNYFEGNSFIPNTTTIAGGSSYICDGGKKAYVCDAQAW